MIKPALSIDFLELMADDLHEPTEEMQAAIRATLGYIVLLERRITELQKVFNAAQSWAILRDDPIVTSDNLDSYLAACEKLYEVVNASKVRAAQVAPAQNGEAEVNQ